jgi:hypothetical protein
MDGHKTDRKGGGSLSSNQQANGAVALMAIALGLSYWNIYAPLIPLGALIIYWLAVLLNKRFSLRTMLIAFAVVAVAIGMIVAVSR